MNQKTKLKIAVSIMLIAISLLIGLITISTKKISNIELPTSLVIPAPTTEIIETHTVSTPQTREKLNPTSKPAPTSEATPTIEPTNPTYLQPDTSQAIAKITIETSRKTRTYDIMPDVEEQTLKNNIGHLPGSSLPGEAGTCVLMGHRDADLSILKYSKPDDYIFIKYNDTVYTYVVKYTQIVQSRESLKFEVFNNNCLVLVTCYPFMYTGNAPKKIIIMCDLFNPL